MKNFSSFILATLLLAACGQNRSSNPAVVTPPSDQQKKLEEKLQQEQLALAPLADFDREKIQAWKSFPVKQCSFASVYGPNPMEFAVGDRSRLKWDIRNLYQVTAGRFIAETPSYILGLDINDEGSLPIEDLADSNLLERREVAAGNNQVNLRLQQAGDDCFLLVNNKVAYQTNLSERIIVSTYSRLAPVGGGPLSGGAEPRGVTAPHQIARMFERENFNSHLGLSMKLSVLPDAEFLAGLRKPAESRFEKSPIEEFMELWGPQALRLYPEARSQIVFRTPNVAQGRLSFNGLEGIDSINANDSLIFAKVNSDPFQSADSFLQFTFFGPDFEYGLFSNQDRLLQIQQRVRVNEKVLSGIRVNALWVGESTRVVPWSSEQVRQCLEYNLTQRPFLTNRPGISQLQSACGLRYSKSDLMALAVANPKFVQLAESQVAKPVLNGPNWSTSLMTEIYLLALPILKYQPLSTEWAEVNFAPFRYLVSFNAKINEEFTANPAWRQSLTLVSEKAGIYQLLPRGPQSAIDGWVNLADRFKKATMAAKMEAASAAELFGASEWLSLSPANFQRLIAELPNSSSSVKTRILRQPSSVANEIIEREREEARQKQLRARIASFEATVNQLSANFNAKVTSSDLRNQFANYFDRESRNQITAPHGKQVNDLLAALDQLKGSTHLDFLSDLIVSDWRALARGPLAERSFAALSFVLRTPVEQGPELLKIKTSLEQLGLTVNLTDLASWVSRLGGREILDFSLANIGELERTVSTNRREVLDFIIFMVDLRIFEPAQISTQLLPLIQFLYTDVYPSGRSITAARTDFTQQELAFLLGFHPELTQFQVMRSQIAGEERGVKSGSPYAIALLKRLANSDQERQLWTQFLRGFFGQAVIARRSCDRAEPCLVPFNEVIRRLFSGREQAIEMDFSSATSGELLQPLVSSTVLKKYGFLSAKEVTFFALFWGLGQLRNLQTMGALLTHFAKPEVQNLLKQLGSDLKAAPAGVRKTTIQQAIDETIEQRASNLYLVDGDFTKIQSEVKKIFQSMRDTTNKERLATLLGRYRELMNLTASN